MTLNEIHLVGTLNLVFDSVHQHVVELVHVHLLKHIHRLPFPVFVGIAEPARVVVLLVALRQCHEHALELKQGILILLQLQELRVDAIEKRLSEARNHIELLKQRVHVADASKIFDADISCLTLVLVL